MRNKDKDIYIKQKLKEDKDISSKAEKIFEKFKENLKMKDDEKKVITISLNKVIAIAACLIIVAFLGTNIYANSLGKPNIFSAVKGLINKEKEENVDEIAKQLFEKAAYEIRNLAYSGLEEYEFNSDIKKQIDEKVYYKTNEKFETVEQKYGEIFTGEALENVLAKRFLDVDGDLYILSGGASGWNIENISVKKINEKNDIYTYEATYENMVGFDEYYHSEGTYTSMFKIQKENGKYKISNTNYLIYNNEESQKNENNNSTKEVIGNNLNKTTNNNTNEATTNTSSTTKPKEKNMLKIWVGNKSNQNVGLVNNRIVIISPIDNEGTKTIYTNNEGWAEIELTNKVENSNVSYTLQIGSGVKASKVAITVKYENYKPVLAKIENQSDNGEIKYIGVENSNIVETHFYFYDDKESWTTVWIPGMKITYPSNWKAEEINRGRWNLQQGEASYKISGNVGNGKVTITFYEPEYAILDYTELMKREALKNNMIYTNVTGTTGYNLNSTNPDYIEWRELFIGDREGTIYKNLYNISTINWITKVQMEYSNEDISSIINITDKIVAGIQMTSY